MRSIIAHGHIFKNAGSTLDWSLRRSFGDDFMDHRDDAAMLQDGTEHLRELFREQSSLKAISSHHLTARLPELTETRITPVYLLRHPIERMRSVYEFERQQVADTPGARAAKEKDFQEYVEWRMQPEVRRTIRNYQTCYLAGWHTAETHLSPDPECFADALKRIQGDAIVGTVERYDDTMVVIEYRLREHFPSLDLAYLRQNVTAGRGEEPDGDILPMMLDRLGELAGLAIDQNRLDLALHALADKQLDAVIDEIPDFQDRLEAFQSRCAALQTD